MKWLGILLMICIGSACSVTGGRGSGGASSSVPKPGNVTTTFQDPDGLQISANSSAGTPRQLVVADLNGDSYPDILLFTDSGVYFYANKVGASWENPSLLAPTSGQSYRIGVESAADIISFRNGSYLSVLTNGGTGAFTETSLSSNPTSSASSLAFSISKSSATQGFVFVAAASTGSHFICSRSGSTLGTTTTTIASSIAAGNVSKVLSGDLDGDGYSDFVLLPLSGSTVELFKNNSDSTIDSSPTGTITRDGGGSIRDAILADLDADSKLDLLLFTSTGMEAYLGAGKFSDFTFSRTLSPSSLSVAPMAAVLSDVTGDGEKDLFFAQSGNTSILRTRTANLVYSDITATAFGSLLTANTIAVYAADIDQDGFKDLIELKSDKSIAIHINNLTKS